MLPGLDAGEFPYPQVELGLLSWTHSFVVMTILGITAVMVTFMFVTKSEKPFPVLCTALFSVSIPMAFVLFFAYASDRLNKDLD